MGVIDGFGKVIIEKMFIFVNIYSNHYFQPSSLKELPKDQQKEMIMSGIARKVLQSDIPIWTAIQIHLQMKNAYFLNIR